MMMTNIHIGRMTKFLPSRDTDHAFFKQFVLFFLNDDIRSDIMKSQRLLRKTKQLNKRSENAYIFIKIEINNLNRF